MANKIKKKKRQAISYCKLYSLKTIGDITFKIIFLNYSYRCRIKIRRVNFVEKQHQSSFSMYRARVDFRPTFIISIPRVNDDFEIAI